MNKYKEFIKEIYKEEGYTSEQLKLKMEYRFPKLFKDDSLVVGQWYRYPNKPLFLAKITDKGRYGIDTEGNWFNESETTNRRPKGYLKATKEEVLEALKNEAVKIGFKKGAYYDATKLGFPSQKRNLIKSNTFTFDGGILLINGWEIFKDGIWAEILPTITKEQAEKELNKIIID